MINQDSTISPEHNNTISMYGQEWR